MISFRGVQVGQIRRSKWANLDERTHEYLPNASDSPLPRFGWQAGQRPLQLKASRSFRFDRQRLSGRFGRFLYPLASIDE
jgi:hypothetical protein